MPGAVHGAVLNGQAHALGLGPRDNWQYVYGGKGADTDDDGLRESDCAAVTSVP